MPCTVNLPDLLTRQAKRDVEETESHLEQKLQPVLFDILVDCVLHLVRCEQTEVVDSNADFRSSNNVSLT